MFRRRTPITYVVVLLVALAALWWGLGFASRERAPGAGGEEDRGEQQEIDERGEVTPSAPKEMQVGIASEFRSAAVSAIEEQASVYLPEGYAQNPIARIWFADDRGMYVEYRRAGAATADRMVFFALSGDVSEVILTHEASYGTSDAGGWELMAGEEALFTKPQKDLYEKNAKGEWVKVN